MRTGNVKDREWMLDAMKSAERVFKLYRADMVPKSVEGFMIATPCKRVLRMAYNGSNMKVGWFIFWDAVYERLQMIWIGFWQKFGFYKSDEEESL